MIDERDLLERALRRFEPEPGLTDRVFRRRDRKRRNQRIAAGVVGFAIFLAAIALVAISPIDRSVTPGGGGEPQPTGPPETTVAPEAGRIVGLPAAGATPSTPEHGRLILYLEGNAGGPFTAVWVYADGRLIWGDVGNLPAGAPTEGATGFVEQHLSPAGVEFLQTQVISTGLFEHDLALLRGPADPGFLTIRVRNGDRLVWLTWAVQENYRVPKDAPPATPEEASTLEGISALIADPMSWPASAWEDQDLEMFVPSRYQVALRVFPAQGEGPDLPVGVREWALLPAPATDLLLRGTKVDQASYELRTGDTRALAEALNEAGLEPLAMPMAEAVLRYTLEDPYEPGNSLFVFFGPVLPHGEAIFLGPG
jgi:hypothetical protein